MSVHETNPAGRLFLFANYTNNAPGNEALREVWSKYFNARTVSDFMSGMAQVLDLPYQIRLLVDEATNLHQPAELLLRGVGPLEGFLNSDIAGSSAVQHFVANITAANIADLEHCSYALLNVETTANVPEETLDKIRELVHEIIKSVRDDEHLDQTAREEILAYAHQLARAVDLFKVTGTGHLSDEVDRFYGVVSRENLKDRVPANLWQKVNNITVVVLMAVQAITAPSDLAIAYQGYSHVFELPASTEAPGLPQLTSTSGNDDV